MNRLYTFKRANTNKTTLRTNWLLAIGVLLLAGFIYRHQAIRLKVVSAKQISLPLPLKALPLTIDDWVGQDIPVPNNIQRVSKNDDFINRLYINKSTNQWANVYVAYSGRPRTMLGHRPKVCYVAGGWVHDITEQSQFSTSAGKTVPCLIHHFHKPAPDNDKVVVLNFYILNGRFTCDEKGFSGLGWRTPNIAGDPAHYVSQVQMSSVLENSVLTAAKDMTEIISDFFPDQHGEVRAAEYKKVQAAF